jgi:hypothetical protein
VIPEMGEAVRRAFVFQSLWTFLHGNERKFLCPERDLAFVSLL